MSIILNKQERMLFALLKASLNEEKTKTEPFENATEEEWVNCRILAKRQGVMALAWDGITMLPEPLKPPRKIKIKWALAVEKQEKRYIYYCKIASELTDFFRHNGIGTIVLKGIGLSSYYPIPSHREGGDIDIYTYSLDKVKMSDKEANDKADLLMTEQGIKVEHENYKHSEFIYKGIPFENHKYFVNTKIISDAKVINSYLHENIVPRQLTLCKKYEVYFPSDLFNSLFTTFHAIQHLGDEFSLHHLYDWASILNRIGYKFPKDICNSGFIKFVDGMTSVSNDFLGTKIPIDSNSDTKDLIIQEILRNPYNLQRSSKIKINPLLFKCKKLYHKYVTLRKFVELSLLKTLWWSIVFHLKKPKAIFKI